MTNTAGKYVEGSYGRRLVVKNVKEENEGWYDCIGENSVGLIKNRVQLKVVCKYF